MENKYSNGKIYVIKFTDNENLIYIGSSIQSLNERFRQHKKDYNTQRTSLHKLIKDKYDGKFDKCYIELFQNYSCQSKKELEIREGNVIQEMIQNKKDLINKNIAGRPRAERLIADREKISEKQKLYRYKNIEKVKEADHKKYIKNKQKRLEQAKEYYIKNLEEIKNRTSTKIQCDCGAFIAKGNISIHKKTKNHIDLMANLANIIITE
jgi:hypothetical protein